MAYVSKELKAKVAGILKNEFGANTKAEVLNRGFRYSLSVQNHSTLVFTISEGTIDFINNFKETNQISDSIEYIDVNTYHINNIFSGDVKDLLIKIKNILNTDNFDNSDPMTDYFHVGHYISIHIGKWNKPYRLLG